jgi:hypothetical protein
MLVERRMMTSYRGALKVIKKNICAWFKKMRSLLYFTLLHSTPAAFAGKQD